MLTIIKSRAKKVQIALNFLYLNINLVLNVFVKKMDIRQYKNNMNKI